MDTTYTKLLVELLKSKLTQIVLLTQLLFLIFIQSKFLCSAILDLLAQLNSNLVGMEFRTHQTIFKLKFRLISVKFKLKLYLI